VDRELHNSQVEQPAGPVGPSGKGQGYDREGNLCGEKNCEPLLEVEIDHYAEGANNELA
jgi:hypothetical protein